MTGPVLRSAVNPAAEGFVANEKKNRALVAQLREALGPRADVERVIQMEPMLLLADIEQVCWPCG